MSTFSNHSAKSVSNYVSKIAQRVKAGHTSEHTFRKDLEDLINALVPAVNVTNEPSKVTDCGNPDFLISKKDIPIGFIEAKDVGKDLKSKQYREQFDRYKAALDNLIITDYLRFQFYVNGERVHEICVGELVAGVVQSHESAFERLAELLRDFCVYVGQTIKSAQRLAILMAGKARLLENTLYQALTSDEESNTNTDLRDQFNTFKTVLIHDLTPKDFADIYAQTLAYGMFAARLHDDTLDTFSRQEAAELIPKTNPFLRKLFSHVAGVDIDDRIKPTVDNLADVFRATDVAAMLKDFGKSTQTQDPIIHFYETFLKKYDPELRKGAGVYYTPKPVVQFIVRAVDNILKSEFDLPEGIADTSKIEIEKQTQVSDSRTKSGFKTIKELVHKVQILDPATGTGTFLAAIIQHIFHNQFENMGGIWSSYVEQDLLPRLHGFELLMASYAIAHLKLDMLLTETGYEPIKPKRMQVYLTNSLEEHNPDTGTLFAGWLSAEANEANAIKRDAPVMVVIGNPPYSVSSSNKGEWIKNLIADYKKNLNEKKINLNDDYIKFIRYGQHYIEKNGEGILAYITNNSFIDGVTHRQMRKSLLETFDKIYILDLHGSYMKNEVTPEGNTDENVFDIMQGVSVNILVKNKQKSKDLADVYHSNLFGLRQYKYDFLHANTIQSINWKKLDNLEPNYFFIEKNYDNIDTYNKGFELDKVFKSYGSGLETQKDKLTIKFTRKEIEDVYNDFRELDEQSIFKKYSFIKDTRDWKVSYAKKDILNSTLDNITLVNYRPFDYRYTVYTGVSKGFLAYPRSNIFDHANQNNIFLLCCKRQTSFDFQHVFLSRLISERCSVSLQTGEVGYAFPLYISSDENNQNDILRDKGTRIPNLDEEVVASISRFINLPFSCEKADNQKTFAPIDILDYIYAVLHSLTYRETYKEFLKIDFPRVPYPSDAETFWQLVSLGGELRQIHLLESPKLSTHMKTLNLGYPMAGDNAVTRKMTTISIGFELDEADSSIGKVWINEAQYFTNVPLVAWEFYIGGYQPAQKWLKDRRERTLDHNEIKHYMNIIAALSLTDTIMQQIDEVDFI